MCAGAGDTATDLWCKSTKGLGELVQVVSPELVQLQLSHLRITAPAAAALASHTTQLQSLALTACVWPELDAVRRLTALHSLTFIKLDDAPITFGVASSILGMPRLRIAALTGSVAFLKSGKDASAADDSAQPPGNVCALDLSSSSATDSAIAVRTSVAA